MCSFTHALILRFQVQLVLSSTKEFKSKHGQNEFELYRKYQLVVHNDKVGGINEFYNFLVDSPLKVNNATTCDEGRGNVLRNHLKLILFNKSRI